MWLPKFLYESIPFWWLALGVAGLGAAFFIEGWYWPELLAASGVLAVILGLVLLLRRRGYRTSRSRLDFDSSG
jgi:hypothetical protein